MTEILQTESTLTDRYQTTVPDIVRKTLGLNKRDKITYAINSNGTVTITRSETSEEDPVLGKFLDFLVDAPRA
jgi:antitoxin PrlF